MEEARRATGIPPEPAAAAMVHLHQDAFLGYTHMRTFVRYNFAFEQFWVISLDYLQMLFDHLFAPAGQVADFGYVQPAAHKELYALIILDVPVHSFLAVVDLAGYIRRSHLFLIQFQGLFSCG